MLKHNALLSFISKIVWQLSENQGYKEFLFIRFEKGYLDRENRVFLTAPKMDSEKAKLFFIFKSR